MRRHCIVMVGTAPETRGGISSVINVYRDAGFFEKWGVAYVTSHVDGSSAQKCVTAIKSIFQFTLLLFTRKVSIVHIHSASDASFWRKAAFVWIAHLARRAVIFHLHGGGFIDFYSRQRSLAKQLIGSTLHQADRIVVLSARWKEQIRGITRNDRIVVIGNPVNISKTDYADGQRNKNVILFLGRIEKEKGIFDLVDAVAKIVIDYPSVRLLVAGQGDITALEARARSAGVADNVSIRGWVSGKEKERVLNEASILALPSYFEGLPMGVLEAMAHSLPIVASTVGAIPEVVTDGVEGILVNPGDILGLTEALRKLLGDDDLQTRMGQASQTKIATHYKIDIVIQEIEQLYRELGASPMADGSLGHGV